MTAPAAAEPCAGGSNGYDHAAMVGFTLGVDIAPKLSLIGGIEGRACVSDETELVLRIELGGGGSRVIAGARARPLEDGDWNEEAPEKLGIEAGVAVDLAGRWGAHLAGTYGYNYAYLAVQALFPLTRKPNLPSVTRTSLVAGFSPWAYFSTQVIEGRPITVGGRIVTPDILALAPARSAEDRAVRDHFTRSARFEYSSVWTFLRLAAELHATAAPAHLIAAALDAADDEVRHAELCAHAAGGLQLAPLAMLAAQPRFTRRCSAALTILAGEAWAEGCLNEGAAAEEARLASGEAQGPVCNLLAVIARDEARHAALAWGVLAWVHSVAPEVARDAVATLPHASIVTTPDDAALARRGVASSAVTAAARAHASSTASARLRELLS